MADLSDMQAGPAGDRGSTAPAPPQGGLPVATESTSLLNPDGAVAADVPCRRCSYNLRGLPVGGRCPECGIPVGLSVHGDLLKFSDPAWLAGLSRGAGAAFWGLLLTVGGGLVATLLARALGPWVVSAANVAGNLVHIYGAWLLTAPDPSGLGEDRYGAARKTIRIALAVGAAEKVMEGAAVVGGFGPAVASRDLWKLLMAVQLAAGVIGVVGQFAFLRYLERLAERIPDPQLSGRARTLFWGYGGTLGAMMVLGAIMVIVAAAGGGRGTGGAPGMLVGFGCLMLILSLALLVFGIMFLALLYRLKTAFAVLAEQARWLWGGGSGEQ